MLDWLNFGVFLMHFGIQSSVNCVSNRVLTDPYFGRLRVYHDQASNFANRATLRLL